MMLLSLAFTLFLVAAYQLGHVSLLLLIGYGLASIVAFILYGIDKRAAINGNRRIPEAHLHLFALVGGWPGALLAMSLFRHKLRKASFKTIFWIAALSNAVILAGWLLRH